MFPLHIPGCQNSTVKVGVALMQSYDPDSANLASDLYDRWPLGPTVNDTCDLGILYFISLHPKAHNIFVGSSLQGILTEHIIHNILYLVENDVAHYAFYGHAIQKVFYSIYETFLGDPPQDQSPLHTILTVVGILAFIAVLIGAGTLCTVRFKQEFRTAKARLVDLQRLQSQLATGDHYNVTSCPICLEDYSSPSAANTAPEASEDEPLLSSSDHRSMEQSTPQQRKNSNGSSNMVAFEIEGDAAAPAGTNTMASGTTRKPLTLPCKHTFCELCITSWMGKKDVLVCPLCRSPFGGERLEEGRPSSGILSLEELLMRLDNLRQRYPSYIDDEMARLIRDDIEAGRRVRPVVFENLELREPGLGRAIRGLSDAGRRGWRWGWPWRRS